MAKRSSRSQPSSTTPSSPAEGGGDPSAQPVKSGRARASRSASSRTAAAAEASTNTAAEDTFAARADDDTSIDASSSATRSDSMGSEPSEEEIRKRAYQRYLERGARDGRHFEDWLEAEKELKANHAVRS
jgi:hypothetical protein